MSLPNALCKLHNCSVTFAGSTFPALKNVNLTIAERRRLVIIGESGSGKTTLARLLANLLPETAAVTGEVVWKLENRAGGRPVGGRDIAYIFQDPTTALNPLVPIGKQIGEAAQYHLGLSKRDIITHVLGLLKKLQLPTTDGFLKSYPHQLSGGQKQRVALAAAIAANPSLIIADEVTSALDNEAQAAIIALLNSVKQDYDATLITICHDMGVAAQLADDIAVMHGGEIIEYGSAETILRSAQHPYSQALISSTLGLRSPPLVRV